MKKLFVAMLVAMLMLFSVTVDAKVLKHSDFLPVEVPDLAPEFYNWPGGALGGLELAPGKEIVVIQAVNDPAEPRCMVLALFFKDEKGIHLVGIMAHYLDGTRDCYEDEGFKKNGIPSGKLVPQKSAMTMDDLQRIFPKKTQI